jgi:hypothetical protein
MSYLSLLDQSSENKFRLKLEFIYGGINRKLL